MTEVTFYSCPSIDESALKFAVIATKYKDKWIFCRHKERATYEMPGGHRGKCENICDTAKRELYEETGALDFDIVPVCVYSVMNEGELSFGMLFTANVKALGPLPKDMEMEEIIFCDKLPEKLTYPQIEPKLFEYISMENPKVTLL